MGGLDEARGPRLASTFPGRGGRVVTLAGTDRGRPGLDDVDGHQVRELVAESTIPSSSRDNQRGLVGTRVIVDIRGQVLAIRGMTRMASTWAKSAKRANRANRGNRAKSLDGFDGTSGWAGPAGTGS